MFIYKKPIYGGLQFVDGSPVFNWKQDDMDHDVVCLAHESSGTFDEDGVRYIYGYKYQSNKNSDGRVLFRQFIKHASPNTYKSEDVSDFIEMGVLQIEEFAKFNNFGALVHVEPSHSPSLVDEIGWYISEHTNCPYFDYTLVKRLCSEVTIDNEKLDRVLKRLHYGRTRREIKIAEIHKEFEDLKKSGATLVEMKHVNPSPIRTAFSEFLKFKDEDQRVAYSALQGVDVLIYDDLWTSGSTVKEIVRPLRSVHDNNRLTVFVLVKQH